MESIIPEMGEHRCSLINSLTLSEKKKKLRRRMDVLLKGQGGVRSEGVKEVKKEKVPKSK